MPGSGSISQSFPEGFAARNLWRDSSASYPSKRTTSSRRSWSATAVRRSCRGIRLCGRDLRRKPSRPKRYWCLSRWTWRSSATMAITFCIRFAFEDARFPIPRRRTDRFYRRDRPPLVPSPWTLSPLNVRRLLCCGRFDAMPVRIKFLKFNY